MKVLFDVEGKVNYDEITRYTTVHEVLNAIDMFLSDNPLPCDRCEESCCKKSWAVGFDNICVNRHCNWDDQSIRNFIQDRLIMKENLVMEFDQYVLKKEANCSFVTETNLCTIYEHRPIICRLFICGDISHRYNMLRELIGATYLKALVSEEEIRDNRFTQRIEEPYRRNPAVFARDYSILLGDILNYALEEEWLDSKDYEKLYQAL